MDVLFLRPVHCAGSRLLEKPEQPLADFDGVGRGDELCLFQHPQVGEAACHVGGEQPLIDRQRRGESKHRRIEGSLAGGVAAGQRHFEPPSYGWWRRYWTSCIPSSSLITTDDSWSN